MRKEINGVKPLRELLRHTRRYLPAIVISLICGAVGAVFSVIGPDKISDMVSLIEQGLTGQMDLQAIGQIGICGSSRRMAGTMWRLTVCTDLSSATVSEMCPILNP